MSWDIDSSTLYFVLIVILCSLPPSSFLLPPRRRTSDRPSFSVRKRFYRNVNLRSLRPIPLTPPEVSSSPQSLVLSPQSSPHSPYHHTHSPPHTSWLSRRPHQPHSHPRSTVCRSPAVSMSSPRRTAASTSFPAAQIDLSPTTVRLSPGLLPRYSPHIAG